MPQCCGRSFTSNGIRNHLDNSAYHANEIECRWCYARWPTHDGKLRLRHEQREHWLACEVCQCIFSNEDGLQQHKDDEHPANYCYGCQRQFQSLNNLKQHLKSSVHVGKNVECPWCPNKFTNFNGVCVHLESGSCTSGITRSAIDQYCREVDPNHIFTNKQIGWYKDTANPANIATRAAWDGSHYRCYLCQHGYATLRSLNQHLESPAHRQKIYHCPRCRREYTLLSGLIGHLESESCGAFRFMGSPGGLGFVQQLRIGH
ncbi:MAG: hypothetical protein L6R40_002371 [Gallowayella cf. fulva]|nr:MAG: hypothetical protein L6R40_002371 [Xanthomendoza cf. fulva]